MMRTNDSKKAFTLLEIMIVIAVIGLLTAIAVPSFANARDKSQTNSCINNLRQISAAKDIYALQNGTPALSLADFVPAYIKRMPACPAAGNYLLQVLTVNPTCDVLGHTL